MVNALDMQAFGKICVTHDLIGFNDSEFRFALNKAGRIFYGFSSSIILYQIIFEWQFKNTLVHEAKWAGALSKPDV